MDSLSRDVPAGTVGGRMARTSKPAACTDSAIRSVGSLSPMMIGQDVRVRRFQAQASLSRCRAWSAS
jgi:hypothetical protein